MKTTNKMLIVNKYSTFTLKELKEDVLDWLAFIRILTVPKTCSFGTEDMIPFDIVVFNKKIKKVNQNESLCIKVNSDEGEFQLNLSNQEILERAILDNTVFFQYQVVIEDYCETKMKKNGKYGYIRALDEFLYNNVDKIEQRIFQSEEEVHKLPKKYNQQKEVVIDCNQLAGYDSYYNELCFTACWKMYISASYFNIIPKKIFLTLQQVHLVEEIDESIIKIVLYAHPLRWDHPMNQYYQRLFRDQLGFDQLVWNNGIGVLRPPYIEYIFEEHSIQTVQYQNNYFQPISKKEATHFVTRVFNKKEEEYEEHRVNGMLNIQAYFPWIDEEKKEIMNYRVLDPLLSIDRGISAYEFYIRQFLEINVGKGKYQNFQPILRFYLPKKVLKELPIDELKKTLSDTIVSKVKQEDSTTSFDIQNKMNHLSIHFLDDSQLHLIEEEVNLNK